MASIYIMVASYRDPECGPTVRDLAAKRSGRHDLHFGVVWQVADEGLPDLRGLNVQNRVVRHTESRGCCWARSLAYGMYRGQDYVLSLDSHSRVVENWDARLVDLLESLPRKSVVSAFPASYDPARGLQADPEPQTIIGGAYANGIVVPRSVPCRGIREHHLVSAGFLFSRGYLFKEVPYDPRIYFNGEEPTLGLRFWTHGWRLWSPGAVVAYHYYGRPGAARHWLDVNASDLIRASDARTRSVLGGQCFDRHGLGRARTLDEYVRCAGFTPLENANLEKVRQQPLEGA